MNFILLVPVLFVMELFGSVPSSINKQFSGGRSPKLLLNFKNSTLPQSTAPTSELQKISSTSSIPLKPPSSKEIPSNNFDPEEDFDDDDQQYFEDYTEDEPKNFIKKTPDELTTETRRNFIRQMTVELLSHVNQTAFNSVEMMIPSITTFWVMINKTSFLPSSFNFSDNDPLQATYLRGHRWIENEFEIKALKGLLKKNHLEFRFLVSLLSCYALTGEPIYLKRAQEFYDAIYEPFLVANLPTRKMIISHSLEFSLINELLNKKPNFQPKKDSSKILHPFSDLGSIKSLGLLRTKDHLMSIVKSPHANFNIFKAAMDYFEVTGKTFHSLGSPVCVNSTELGVAFCRPPTGEVTVLPKIIPGRDCDLGAMFALAADRLLKISDGQRFKEVNKKKRRSSEILQKRGEDNNLLFHRLQTSDLLRISKYWERAEQLTETCRRMVVIEKNRDKEKEFSDLLKESSRLAESYFTLWRMTHQLKYRDYSWELAQLIFRGLKKDVSKPSKDNFFNSLIPKTLKYLFLIFSSDHLLPLEEWTFNAEGQPLPVKQLWKTLN